MNWPMMTLRLNAALCAAFAVWMLAVPAQAQTAECQLVLLPSSGAASQGQYQEEYFDASAFLDSVYDDSVPAITQQAGLPVRAVMCRRDDIVPTLRDYPILKTGAVLSISQDFDSASSGLLMIYDAGREYKAEYSGPPLSPEGEDKLRDALEIFNLQKLAE